MATLKQFTTRIKFTHDVSEIVTALQELSVLEMQKIRNNVLTTRTYTTTLLDIFIDVRTNYEQLVTKKLKSTPHKPKTALILLSQKARFSDTNINQVFAHFLSEIEKYPQADLILFGQVAAQLATQAKLSRHHKIKNTNDFSELTSLLSEYQQIFVFHGSFKNLVVQEAISEELSGRAALLQIEEQAKRQKRSFMYEPKIEKIIEYFEQEVEKSLLLQAGSESRLAHLGSRIQNLELSRNSIEDELKKLSTKYHRQRHALQAKKQQQRLAGRNVW